MRAGMWRTCGKLTRFMHQAENIPPTNIARVPIREVSKRTERDIREIFDVTTSNVLFPYQDTPITAAGTAWRTSNVNKNVQRNHFYRKMSGGTVKYHIKEDYNVSIHSSTQNHTHEKCI
jgi:CBS domain-containing protein